MLFNKQKILLFLYTICIYLFGCFIRYLEYEDFFLCYDCEEVDSPETLFDYIVVGCGSAGSILARRLAEDKKVKVLLLEAGRHGNSILDIPSFGLLLQQTPFDWQYTTVPQKRSCLSLNNNTSIWPMGKMVGGTSMLNNLVYVRGHPGDFNTWFKNKEGYSFNEYVLPYFEKLEKREDKGDTYGSVYISNLTFSTKLSKYILNAAKELKLAITEHTENCEEGFGLPRVNLLRGERYTSAHTLLKKYRSNIYLHTQRIVEKILFRSNFEAYGVKYRYLGKSYIARAIKGVVLSAGVVGTTKILLHSGIGPKRHLDEVGIKTKVNLPVGENLQDHVTTGFDLVLLKESLGIGIQQILSPYSALNYFWSGTGPWTTVGCEVLGHLHINEINKKIPPDLQFMVMNLGLNEDRGKHFRKLVGITDDIWNEYFTKLNDTITITLLPVLLHPQSKGTIRLKNKNFTSEVLIDPNYLAHPHDVETLVRGIEIIRKLVNTKAMDSLGATFNTNVLPACNKYRFGTKCYWRCYVRHITITSYHPVGTCKMGHEKDKTSVVDFDFKVKGTNNLFVVDGSVLPTLTSGNVNAAILMLAEMASDILKYREFLNKDKSTVKEIFIKKNFCTI